MHPNASMKYNRRYKDFNEFCEYIKTPEEVMNWYKINKIRWNKLIDDEFYKKPINWPDIILKEKEGNCFDHAIFMHYFCEKYNIENCIVRYVNYGAIRSTGKWHFYHHFICILKLEAGWVAFDYDSLPHDGPLKYSDKSAKKSGLTGPFETKEEASKFYSDWYMDRWKEYQKIGIHWKYKEKPKPVTIFLNDKVMRIIDKLYGDRSFTQEEFYNLVKGEMGDTRYEGRDYEYAGFFDELGNDIIVGIDKLRNFREEGDIMQESINEQHGDSYKEYSFLGGTLVIDPIEDPDPNEGEIFKQKYPDLYREHKEEIDAYIRSGMLEAKPKTDKGGVIVHPRDIDWDNDIIPIDYNKKRKPPEERRPKHSIIPKELYEKYADELEEYRKWAERSEREHKEKIDAYNRLTMLEAKLKADERTDYGLPKKKKYPMPDEAHVLQAIRMFNHCDPEDEAELARNIKKYMKKYNMKDVKVGKNNRFSKYYHTKAINEEVRMWGYEIRAMANESLRLLEMSGGGGPMIGMEINDQSVQYSSPGQFIITTKDKDSGVDYGVTNDIKSKYLYRKNKDKGYVKEDMELYLKDKDYKIYQYTGDIDIWKYMLSDIQYNSYDEDTTIYEDLTGRKQLTDDQIDFDENFRYYNIKQVLLESSILNATTKSKLDELKGKKTHLFDTNIKVSDKFSVAESIEGYCLRYGDYHSDFVSLDELTKIYNV